MIGQAFLLAILLAIFLYALSQRRRSRLVSSTVMAAVVMGAGVVIQPELANEVARMVGIGRGADLLSYIFIVVSFAAVFNLHLRARADQHLVTEIVREMAIMKATKPK